VPYGAFINGLPPAFFLAVHLIGFLIGAFFAYRAFDRAQHWVGGLAFTPLLSSCT
jgi:hypothetical protein